MPFYIATSYVPHRWIVCILCCWAYAIINYKNVCFYAIEYIVRDHTKHKILAPGCCPFLFLDDFGMKHDMPFQLPDFYWDSKVVEIAYNAFFIGQLLAAIPAGVLSDLGYSKYVASGGMLLVAINYLLLPKTFDFGVYVYVMLNFIEGFGDGLIKPSIISLISRWSLPSERNTFTAFVMTGKCYGLGLGLMLFKLIYTSWSFGHSITGVFALVWFALCLIFISHSPGKHSLTTRNECVYITRRHRKRNLLIDFLKLHEIPWRQIVTSPSFLSLVLVYCSFNWATFMNIYINLISYQRFILKLPEIVIRNNYTVMAPAVFPSLLMGGILADWIIKHRIVSNTVVKRTFVFISVFCSSVLVCAAYLVGCNIELFWIFTVSAFYTYGLAYSTVFSAPVDYSPRHAGLLMGILVVSRNICYILSRNIEKVLVLDPGNPHHYRGQFLVFAILALAMTIPFLFFGSGENQHLRRPVPMVTHPTVHPEIALETFTPET